MRVCKQQQQQQPQRFVGGGWEVGWVCVARARRGEKKVVEYDNQYEKEETKEIRLCFHNDNSKCKCK